MAKEKEALRAWDAMVNYAEHHEGLFSEYIDILLWVTRAFKEVGLTEGLRYKTQVGRGE